MSREWKPGDVGLVPFASADEVGIFTHDGWVTRLNLRPLGYSDVRPLVVIDPDSDDDLSRLWRLLPDNLVSADQLQAALREFANPTPPRPDEPTGLGAVVEDEDGDEWIRVGGPRDGLPRPWAGRGNVADLRDWHRYADIAAVRVLSEGVQ